MTTERQRLLNKVELLKIDLDYKSVVYIRAYSLLGHLQTLVNRSPIDVAEMAKLIDSWAKDDEAQYKAWNERSREAKREQRKRRKAHIAREGGPLVRAAAPGAE